MDRNTWKIKRTAEILGIPHLDTRYLPPHVIIALREHIAEIEDVGAVILYGSMVRGEASPKSDIDIMVIPIKKDDPDVLRQKLMGIFRRIEDEYNLQPSFSLLIYSGEEDPYFIWETIKDGVVLYCKPEITIQAPENIIPYALISYTYTGLKEKEKKQIRRHLFSSKKSPMIDKNNKMEYIAPGVLLLPLNKAKQVTELFETMNIKYSLLKVWR